MPTVTIEELITQQISYSNKNKTNILFRGDLIFAPNIDGVIKLIRKESDKFWLRKTI